MLPDHVLERAKILHYLTFDKVLHQQQISQLFSGLYK